MKTCSVQLPVDVQGVILGVTNCLQLIMDYCANSLRPTGSDPKTPEVVSLEGSPRWRDSAREREQADGSMRERGTGTTGSWSQK